MNTTDSMANVLNLLATNQSTDEFTKELKETAEDIMQTRGDEIMTLEQKFEDIKYFSELEKSQEIAERMIKRGYPIEDICDVTRLSNEQVLEIKKRINQ